MNDVDLGGFFVSYSPRATPDRNSSTLTVIGREGKFLR
jgi:hypothetical protein